MKSKVWTGKSLELRRKDRQFDNIGPAGIGRKLRETVWSEYMPDAALIASRSTKTPTAPVTTRARDRGALVVALAHRTDVKLGWDGVQIENYVTPMPDPRVSHDPKMKRIIEVFGNPSSAPLN